MFARDFRAWAREALTGHWGAAVAVGLVASLLGGGLNLTSGIDTGITVKLDGTVEQSSVGLLDFIPRDLWAMLLTVTIVTTLLALVIGGAVLLGVATFNLNLFHRREARLRTCSPSSIGCGRASACSLSWGSLCSCGACCLCFPV